MTHQQPVLHRGRPGSAAAGAAVGGAGALAVLSVAQFLIALDYSIVYVALPSIARDLRLGPAAGQWVISAYAVFFAGFLLVGGRLADRVGAGRLFVAAIVLFGAASAAGGVAGGGATLLAARGAQGLGAALLQPAVLGLIGAIFPAGRPRSRALAVWGAVGAAGLAVGVLLGGLLTTASWRLTFFLSVPLALLAVLGALRWFGPARDRNRASRIPVLASVLATAAVLALVASLTLCADRGWRSAATVGSLGLALLLLLGAGFALAAGGLGWIAGTLQQGSYATGLLAGLILSGFGHGVVYTSMFIIGTRDVPARFHGTAGALLTTSQYVAGSVTIAVLTLVLGRAPGAGAFRVAFLLTAAAAVAGLGLAALRCRRPPAAGGP